MSSLASSPVLRLPELKEPKPMLLKATIEILIDAESEAEASDAIFRAMSPLLKEPGVCSCTTSTATTGERFVDWEYVSGPPPTDGAGLEHRAREQ